ncbi:hypothetical protein Tco_0071588, partial [Tanacetum coccineum]
DVVAVEIVVVVLVLLRRLYGGVDAVVVWLLLTVVGGDDALYAIPNKPDSGLLKYSLMGFTWAFKDVMNRERRESRSSIFLQRPYMPLLATTIAPKKRANKSSNKKGNANVSAFDLGKAVVDDNAQDYEVMITGARATEDYVSFKNVDPNKVA